MTPTDEIKTASCGLKSGCSQPNSWLEVCYIIKELYGAKNSLRRIAKEDFGGKITHSALHRVLHGQEPRAPQIRAALGLPAYQSVVVVTGEAIPPGTQIIGALLFCLDCGRAFIPNHPRRRKCFICSEYKGKSYVR